MELVLLIIFVVVMLVWLLNELGAIAVPRAGLLAWIAVLVLALLANVFHLVR